MSSYLNAHFCSTPSHSFLCTPDYLLNRQVVALLIHSRSAEGTEPASLDTHVREVDVPAKKSTIEHKEEYETGSIDLLTTKLTLFPLALRRSSSATMVIACISGPREFSSTTASSLVMSPLQESTCMLVSSENIVHDTRK
jgi:hypothetical protein